MRIFDRRKATTRVKCTRRPAVKSTVWPRRLRGKGEGQVPVSCLQAWSCGQPPLHGGSVEADVKPAGDAVHIAVAGCSNTQQGISCTALDFRQVYGSGLCVSYPFPPMHTGCASTEGAKFVCMQKASTSCPALPMTSIRTAQGGCQRNDTAGRHVALCCCRLGPSRLRYLESKAMRSLDFWTDEARDHSSALLHGQALGMGAHRW